MQPMDQGIIQATKWKFCKLQLQNMTPNMEMYKEKCMSEILKKIDAPQAITWIKKIWGSVIPGIIQKLLIAKLLLIANILPSY